jgi:DNA-binding NarL/FixJ family response regulator
MTKRIVLVEDDFILRQAFTTLINESEHFHIVNAWSNAEDALKNIMQDHAHIYLMDIELPGINGVDAIAKIKQATSAKVMILSVYENDDLVFKALCEGASGYLTKNISPSKLIDSLKELENGGAPMSTNIVLELLASGKSYSTIANNLFLDKETIRSHIKNIYLKLEVHSKADAIEKARKNKFI